MTTPKHIAVIGVGICGAAALNALHAIDDTLQLSAFDKGWRPGGRLSTREPRGGGQFDHGAPMIHITQQEMLDELRPVINAWPDSHLHSYIGEDKMSSVVNHLLDASRATLFLDTRIVSIQPSENKTLSLIDAKDTHHGPFDGVLLTAPAPQTATLIESLDPHLAHVVHQIPMEPQWALLLELELAHPVDFSLKVMDDPLAKIIRDTAKPMRPNDRERWIIQASPQWSKAHLEHDKPEMARIMLNALKRTPWFEAQRPTVHAAHAHRWRYATTTHHVEGDYLMSEHHPLYLAGDWCGGGGAQGAFHSGRTAAHMMHFMSILGMI